jgi:outer membrane protein insertion porin family
VRSCYPSLLVLVLASVPGVGEGQSESARIYVRRIEFQGVEGIADEVLRRELVQLEGTFLNTVALEQSRLQLEQLPYIESARALLQPIDGALNQVDVLIDVTQAPARIYGGGGAWSESQGASIHGYFTNENIFGKGQRFSATANLSELRTLAELSHTNPFTGSARVSRTISLASRRLDQLTTDTTELEADITSAQLTFAYRTGERHSIGLGLALNDAGLATKSVASDQWVAWVLGNGNPTVDGTVFSTDFRSVEFLLRWRQDTRNRDIFPDRGLEQSVTLRSAIPGSEVEYYAIDYALTRHWPLNGRWEARLDAGLGYGAAYSSATSSLPPFLNRFAGGPDSVRGYRGGWLGPRDSLGNPYGGNLFAAGQFELMMPLPEKLRGRMRIGIFYDIGNAFSTEDVTFLDGTGESLDYGFEFSRMRRSAGISARVLIPVGVVRLSYGIPLNADDEHPNPYLRDDIERFQIAIGVDF